MNFQAYRKQIVTAVVTIAVIVAIGKFMAGTNAVQNVDSLFVSKPQIECYSGYSTVLFNLVNTSNKRVDKARVVVTVTNRKTGKTKTFESVYRSGVLAKESLSKSFNIDRFNCDEVDVSAEVYSF